MRNRTHVVRLCWLLLSVVVAACAPARIEIDPTARTQVQSASVVHLVAYPSEAPPLLTAKAMGTGALFGAIGGAVVGARAASIGKDLMAKYKVEDLSSQLANKLAEMLKDAVPNLKRASEFPLSQEADDLKKAGLRPYVLDVKSGGSIIYYASNWARYRLVYSARTRLLDTEDGRVLWQGVCSLKGEDDASKSPTLDELEAADGVAYRRLITDAIGTCGTQLVNDFLGQGAPPQSTGTPTPGGTERRPQRR